MFNYRFFYLSNSFKWYVKSMWLRKWFKVDMGDRVYLRIYYLMVSFSFFKRGRDNIILCLSLSWSCLLHCIIYRIICCAFSFLREKEITLFCDYLMSKLIALYYNVVINKIRCLKKIEMVYWSLNLKYILSFNI